MATTQRPQPRAAVITFAVPGEVGPPDGATATRSAGSAGGALRTDVPLPGQVKHSVRVATQRDAGATQRLDAVPGEDIVALHISQGPVLLLHPETARALLQGPRRPRRGDTDVQVQAQLHWPGLGTAGLVGPAEHGDAATRGLADIGRVVVSAFQVLTGLSHEPLVNFATSQIVQRVDAQVDAGVYALQAQALNKLKGSGHKLQKLPASQAPILVLIHGTFVDTSHTFQKLWLHHRGLVDQLFAHYGQAVYALDHPTLGASPISNARTLVEALPDGARLHLLTHSRGGLVAEVLARLAGQGTVGASDLAFFSDAAYAAQRDELKALADLIKAKRVTVERVVRVACPARGTLLASGRLDAYVSVLKWTLELAGLHILPAFLEFAGEVARRRANPAELPGLAAMMPNTPLLNWLNAAPQPLPGDLRVVSGDLQAGDTIGSWLKALLADAYYWTDNDIVVHTRSMYGGAPRVGGASFMLDKSAAASHFTYFVNPNTAAGVVDALLQAAAPAAFKTIGPLSWAGKDAGGARGAAAQRSAPDAHKPAVVVLPGLLGSHLKQGDHNKADRIWLSPRVIADFERLAFLPDGADGVTEDGPMGQMYDKLVAFLSRTHDVIAFGYDWRRPLQDEAARLATVVSQALDARHTSGQPVRFLAHSMGGLLLRTMQIVAPEVWQRVMAPADARLVMLGVPHGGSWAPMQVLSGDDGLGNMFAVVGSAFANARARQSMSAMPGFMQLQAGLLDPQLALDQETTWRRLADEDFARAQEKSWWHQPASDMMGALFAWGVPPQDVLNQARALREQLDAQLGVQLDEPDHVLKPQANKLVQVLGRAPLTPVGFEVTANEGFVYLNAQGTGDGRVPITSSRLPGLPTWTVDCEHGKLPSHADAFEAYADLLLHGHTTRLAASQETRGQTPAAARVRNRPARQATAVSPTSSVQEMLEGSAVAPFSGAFGTPLAGRSLPALRVTVLNGNLSFVSPPLLLGHYASLELTGTEAVVNRHLAGAMGVALAAGLYPSAPGAQHIFFNTSSHQDNPWRPPLPKAAIVVGLGEEGLLTSKQLEATVSQGVKAWAQRAREEVPSEDEMKNGVEIAATLIGSGGLGISPASAARAIAQGVLTANLRLLGSGWPHVSKLTLVEWYLDRATEAWRGLQVLAQSSPHSFDITPTIVSGTGPLRRQPETGYRGAAYDLISATTSADGTVSYALDTRRARTEVRAQRTQINLLKKLVARAATARSSDASLGKTLFQLLVPLELKPFMSGNDRLVLQLDEQTAPIPWELLDTRTETTTETATENTTEASASAGAAQARDIANDLPWAIRTQLLRKLAISDIPNTPRDANADDAVLVIGEPLIDDDRYPALPGAQREAQAVAARLLGPGGIGASRLKSEINAPFDQIIMTLMARPYRIIHIAGHGEAVTRNSAGQIESSGGVVLSEGVFLGALEIPKLPAVPELVFVNCCHLGSFDQAQTLRKPPPEPVAFAAGVAEALIRVGVRCVVAAGWAVDDEPAEVFANTFYDALLTGQPFVDAVAQARKATYLIAPESKTWAAYQCYGDPNWVFRTHTGDAQARAASAGQEFAGIACAPDLALVLENLAVQQSFYADGDATQQAQARVNAQNKLRDLEGLYANTWASVGAVAEAFGVAWDATGDVSAAVRWYERALSCSDASASIKVQEQLANLRVRSAWSRVRDIGPGKQNGKPAGKKTTLAVLNQARDEMLSALAPMQALALLHPTWERAALCGSTFKRLGQLEALAGDDKASRVAFEEALAAYAQAEALTAQHDLVQTYYPGMNRMALELVQRVADPGWPGFNTAGSVLVRQSLQAACDTQPDFFSHAGIIEFQFYEALAQRDLQNSLTPLLSAYAQLHGKVAMPRFWKSVADQAGFVLAAYLAVASAKEKAAGQALLGALEKYAR